jgi:hypothetical protein
MAYQNPASESAAVMAEPADLKQGHRPRAPQRNGPVSSANTLRRRPRSTFQIRLMREFEISTGGHSPWVKPIPSEKDYCHPGFLRLDLGCASCHDVHAIGK